MSGAPMMSFSLIAIGFVGMLIVFGLIVVIAAVAANSSGRGGRRED